MTTKRLGVAAVFALTACAAAADVAPLDLAATSVVCPAPTVQLGSMCTLDGDVTLTHALWLPSGTHLNCRGHKLVPSAVGVEDVQATGGPCVVPQPLTALSGTCAGSGTKVGLSCTSDVDCMDNEYVPSAPVAGIVVDAARDVKVENCVLEGFDFSIVVMDTAAGSPGGSPSVKILGNTIRGRHFGVWLIGASDALVADNTISFESSGSGVTVVRSSRNHVRNNNISRQYDLASRPVIAPPFSPGERTNTLPGRPFSPGGTVLPVLFNNAIGIIAFGTASAPVVNVVIDGKLKQFPYIPGHPSIFSADNLIENNTIDIPWQNAVLPPQPSVTVFFGLASGDASRGTIFRGNTIKRAARAIHLNGMTFGARATPRRCTGDETRWCSTDDHCAGLGSCPPPAAPFGVNDDGLVRDGWVEDNVIEGPFRDQGLYAGNAKGTVFRGNTVEARSQAGAQAALLLQGRGFEDSVVTRNRLASRVGVRLAQNGAPLPGSNTTRGDSYGSTLFVNDITGWSVAAVQIQGPFAPFHAALTDGARGNYWGLDCPGFDPAQVKVFNSTVVSTDAVDDHPYGQPVAQAADADLPAPCL